MTEKDEKTCFNAETNDFDQRTACRAPVCWSKYTTLGGPTLEGTAAQVKTISKEDI